MLTSDQISHFSPSLSEALPPWLKDLVWLSANPLASLSDSPLTNLTLLPGHRFQLSHVCSRVQTQTHPVISVLVALLSGSGIFVFVFDSHTNSLPLSPIFLFPLSFFSSTLSYKIFLSRLFSEILFTWFMSAAEQHKIKNINGRLSFIRDLTHWHTD